jgi:hypothetical protein
VKESRVLLCVFAGFDCLEFVKGAFEIGGILREKEGEFGKVIGFDGIEEEVFVRIGHGSEEIGGIEKVGYATGRISVG